jgi:ADP-ribosylglycohydrolase
MKNYRKRVMSCWLGKAVGGTLGMPFEGADGPFDLHFYDPVPTEMLPNDDLDLQVVWACVLDQMDEIEVNRHVLARAWLDHVNFPWDEYGVALRNLKNGLRPPLSGSHDNWFKDGMGAPIRSEIWACLAPGQPDLAAAYAYEDACVDHADDGIWGEMFFAALESAAFVEQDSKVLLRDALNTLSDESRVKMAVADTQKWWDELHDWRAVRELILQYHGHENFTDAPMNIAYTVLGWLAGEGDFSRAICIAANCGKDTDCTAATVGALMGIIDPDCIPEKWLAPIGRDLVLSPAITGINPPDTLDGFTDLVLDLQKRLNRRWPEVPNEEQNVEHLLIGIKIGFAPSLPAADNLKLPAEMRDMELSGTAAKLPESTFEDEFAIVEYQFILEESREVLVMFNTPQSCRVWVDGAFLLERENSVMAPSFHRAPPNQSAAMYLEKGRHILVAAVRRPTDQQNAQWVVGVGETVSKQWIANAFSAAMLSPVS